MLLRGVHRTISSHGVELKSHNRLPRHLSLILHVRDTQVDIVVVQLIKDVERGIVTCVDLIGVERTRSVHRIAVGVDIEGTVHRTRHHVGRLVQCSRCLLLTPAIVGEQADAKLLRKVERSVHISSVAFHLRVHGPTRVADGRD